MAENIEFMIIQLALCLFFASVGPGKTAAAADLGAQRGT
jgi:hypothetical protein